VGDTALRFIQLYIELGVTGGEMITKVIRDKGYNANKLIKKIGENRVIIPSKKI
jgi:hypothetical protein